ncbi:sugar-binding domain-containing protein [Mucilaginibacter sp. AW1-3]
MYKKSYICLLFSFLSVTVRAQMTTRWAKEVDPIKPLNEYPRPQMVRQGWINLNGRWEYAVTPKDLPQPQQWDGQLLVPYPIESALSGAMKNLKPDQNLWYHRAFISSKTDQRTLLHFGAVDWQATVYINGHEAGCHTGGYTEFTIDITDQLKSGENELSVKVYDPSDQGIGPHGKQVLNPKDIYYTSSSGIWQTVWLEEVPWNYIHALLITPNVDSGFVAVTVKSDHAGKVQLAADGRAVLGHTNERIKLPIPNAHLWSPTDPYLYDLSVKMGNDEVKSYFGMRKISVQKDEKGIDRIFLNNKYCYNLGVLDQGFWPDGLYTAPTDEALKFDIEAVKAMGFNTIRKHIKIEPARWYYWADKLGMLVWQDMVNPSQGLPEGAKAAFEQQCKETLEQLHNYPCITTWVLFNEKWGQYDQKRLTDWIKQTDPSRLLNGHTGEILYVNEQLRSPSPDAYVDADLTDVHSYPDPMLPIKQPGKAQVLGEFGGIGVAIPGHEWNPYQGWGYIKVSPGQVSSRYEAMTNDLVLLEKAGLSASIYTQPYDVEGEENGLMTYDRQIIKIPLKEMQRINGKLVARSPKLPDILIQDSNKEDEGVTYTLLFDQYLHGKREPVFLKELALMSQRVNDKTGGARVAASYIETLKAPLTMDDLRFTLQFTKSSHDPGFRLMIIQPAAFETLIGKRTLITTQMNCIYNGDIAPAMQVTNNPDWITIAKVTGTYGPAGEEIYLRARMIDALNKKDWENYARAARPYLQKYGANIKEQEKQTFENLLQQHP